MLVNIFLLRMRKGEELKTPRHASAVATRNNHVTIHNIVPTILIPLRDIIRPRYVTLDV
jgi:hypothetical protein